ncbi:hypothetical protein [Stenotrophomonas sp. SMYL20]|uniref:hypothetical protein n=1 Tax=Stenotrophomonas sp. SMYL20 TaxID=3076043 RepID=UPI002E775CF7|nr:hypothetical protein [Stenotrophomonas sp. SMYL20]
MNPREMMARLGPSTVKFDIGRGGGKPDLTNQDIAAALGMVPAGLGRELLEACWWPDGAALRQGALRDAILSLVMPELARQARKLTEVHLDLQLAEAAVSFAGRSPTTTQRNEVARCRSELAVARAATWPKNTADHLPAIARAAIGELSGGNKCMACGGRQYSMEEAKVTMCKECRGTGLEPNPDRRRALAIGCDPSDYPRRWRVVYEWILVKMSDAMAGAERQFVVTLSRDAA